MGAQQFSKKWEGESPEMAFRAARENSLHWNGHAGYTGTLAEKDDFVLIPRNEVPEGLTPEAYAERLMDEEDPRIDDKWGPAGCIEIEPNVYLFFGWASS